MMHTKRNRIGVAIMLVVGLLGSALSAAEKKPPASQPAPPSIDQLLDQLSKMDAKALAAHLAQLQAQAKKLAAEAAALRNKAAQIDGRLAQVNKRIALLSALVKPPAKPAPPKKAQAAPPKKAMAAKPAPAKKAPAMKAKAAPKAAAMKAKPAAKPAAMKAKVAPKAAAMKGKPAAKPTVMKAKAKVALVNYNDHVKPIFVETCAGCHNQDKSRGGLIIDSYTDLMEGGSSGEVITPGDPDGSRLWLLVDHQEKPVMPPKKPKLAADKLKLIRTWIEQGAAPDAKTKPTLAAKPAKSKMLAVAPTATGPAPIPKGAPKKLAPPAPRPTAVTALAASPVAPVLATCGAKQVLLYDVASKKLLAALPFPEGRVQHLEFSRCGRWLIAAGGQIGKAGKVVIFDVVTGKRLGEVGKQYDAVICAAIDPYLELVAVGGSNKMVRVYDLLTDSVAYEIKVHNDWTTAVAFSPDATLLATGDRSGGLFVWEAETGRQVHELRGHGGAIQDVCFRPDSEVLASTGDDGTARLWEMDKGKQIKRWGAHGMKSLSLDFAPDGRICTSGADQVAKLWKIDGKGIRTFEKLGDWVYQACFANGGKCVVAGTWTGQIHVFDTESGKRIWQLDTNPRPDAVALGE